MEAIAQCIENLEPITQLEIKEITKKPSKVLIPSRIKFTTTDKELANFVYNTRSSIKVYKLIKNFEFSSFKDLIIKIEKIKFPKIKSPFAVKCERKGKHDFNSIDIEKEVGKIINKEDKLKVNLNDPTTIILVDIIDNNCFVGIDYTGFKLSKRNYRVKLLSRSLNSCLAYCMLRIANIKEKDIILDPFCKSGEILIESALFLNKIPNCQKILDKLAFTKLIDFKPKNKVPTKKLNINAVDDLQNNLRTTEINAKIAGINKSIKFSRQDIEWLDTKFKEKTIDKIITYPLYPTKTLPKDKIEKIYKEFFYQAKYILKKSITILTPCPKLIEKYAKLNDFKKIKEFKIKYMQETFHIIQFKK